MTLCWCVRLVGLFCSLSGGREDCGLCDPFVVLRAFVRLCLLIAGDISRDDSKSVGEIACNSMCQCSSVSMQQSGDAVASLRRYKG